MKIGEQVVEVAGSKLVAHGGHLVAAVEDGRGDSLVRGGRSARENLLLEDTGEGWTVEGTGLTVIVADGTAGLVDGMALGLLEIKL